MRSLPGDGRTARRSDPYEEARAGGQWVVPNSSQRVMVARPNGRIDARRRPPPPGPDGSLGRFAVGGAVGAFDTRRDGSKRKGVKSQTGSAAEVVGPPRVGARRTPKKARLLRRRLGMGKQRGRTGTSSMRLVVARRGGAPVHSMQRRRGPFENGPIQLQIESPCGARFAQSIQ
jgi:hypothetical protein